MKRFRQKTFIENIRGDKWKIRLLTPAHYIKLHTEPDSDPGIAVTISDEKRIDFRQDAISLNTVIHELCHAYIYYCYYVSTTELQLGDLEEIICEMMGDQMKNILDQANSIYSKLVQYKI